MAVAFGGYLAARLVGTWELYLLSLTFLAALVVSGLLVLGAARKLEVSRTLRPAKPTAGDELVVSVRVTNGSVLPGLQVTVRDVAGDLSAQPQTVELESLGARAQRVAAAAPQPAQRGVHRLPGLRVEAEDPLGLFRARHLLGDPLEITVYPRLTELSSCALFADVGPRRDLGRRGLVSQGATEFRGIRPHYPGEPLNHVDWKATAKTGNLMLREMDDPASGDMTLLLDGTASSVAGQPPETNFELAVQAAGSVADFTLRTGRGVNLLLHENQLRQTHLSPDASGHRRLLDDLARVTPGARVALPSALRSLRSNGGRLLRTQLLTLVTLSLDSDLVRALIALRREGLRISVVYVDAASFAAGAAAGAAGAPPPTAPLVALGAAGVLCLSLYRGDDLHSALSLPQTESPYASLR